MSELLSVFGVNWKLLLAQGINFALLLVVLTYFLYKPVLKMIDERREKIAEGVRTAEKAKEKLANAAKESESIIGEASRNAESLVLQARSNAGVKASEIVKEAEIRAQAVIADAEARADEEKRLALLESEKGIARAAMLAAEKILKRG